MPKQTFFNLPNTKRNTITEIAIDEFAHYGFNKASINRIVKKSNIAKGSFYQYFEDKLDLYRYIIDYITTKKMEYFNDLISSEMDNFFNFLHKLFEAGLQFAAENPKICAITDGLYKNDPLRQMVFGDMESKSHVFFKNLILRGQSKGNIRKDINVDLVSYFLFNLNLSLGELYYKSHNHWSNDEEFRKLTNDIIDILKNGIKEHSLV